MKKLPALLSQIRINFEYFSAGWKITDVIIDLKSMWKWMTTTSTCWCWSSASSLGSWLETLALRSFENGPHLSAGSPSSLQCPGFMPSIPSPLSSYTQVSSNLRQGDKSINIVKCCKRHMLYLHHWTFLWIYYIRDPNTEHSNNGTIRLTDSSSIM